MKRGACREILSSFAWGNANAVEFWSSSVSKQRVPFELWEAVRKAGSRFDGIKHLIQALRPRVVLILSKRVAHESYFGGYEYTTVQDNEGVRHYRLRSEQVDIFHAPHPHGMMREGGASHFCKTLKEMLYRYRLTVPFPNFVQQTGGSDEVVNYLRNSVPRCSSKFDLVVWIAEELKKRDSFMSVPTLSQLLNDLGHRTDARQAFPPPHCLTRTSPAKILNCSPAMWNADSPESKDFILNWIFPD